MRDMSFSSLNANISPVQIRQRCLLSTPYTYIPVGSEDTNLQATCLECPKFYSIPPPQPEQYWTVSPTSSSNLLDFTPPTPVASPVWSPTFLTKPVQYSYLPQENNFTYSTWEQGIKDFDATVSPYGTICLNLDHSVRVDITVDRAIRVINFKHNIILALSETGSSAALLHPNGRIYQYGSRVEILAFDRTGNNKYAKMWYKGISFTSEKCSVIYLVDAAGTRTTTDSFTDLTEDFSLSVFYNNSCHGPECVLQAKELLEDAQFWVNEGIINCTINNIRISQTAEGVVRIARNRNKHLIRTSPVHGTGSLTTPFVHCTASLGDTSHLFVRRGERRMHFDCTSFVVRNAGHSAGFNEKHQLTVF